MSGFLGAPRLVGGAEPLPDSCPFSLRLGCVCCVFVAGKSSELGLLERAGWGVRDPSEVPFEEGNRINQVVLSSADYNLPLRHVWKWHG